MLVEQSILNEVKIIKPEIHIDDRGTFLELFKSALFNRLLTQFNKRFFLFFVMCNSAANLTNTFTLL